MKERSHCFDSGFSTAVLWRWFWQQVHRDWPLVAWILFLSICSVSRQTHVKCLIIGIWIVLIRHKSFMIRIFFISEHASTRSLPLANLCEPFHTPGSSPQSIQAVGAFLRYQRTFWSHARARARPGRPVRKSDRRQVLGGDRRWTRHWPHRTDFDIFWLLLRFHSFPFISMHFHSFPCISIHFHSSPWTWIDMDCMSYNVLQFWWLDLTQELTMEIPTCSSKLEQKLAVSYNIWWFGTILYQYIGK